MSSIEDTGERLIAKGNEQTLTYGEHYARYKSVLPLVKGKTVLDVASGTGYGTKMISEHAKQVTGLDYSADAVQYSQENFGAPNITYKVGDAHDMVDIKDGSIDVVVSFETIEHLKDPARFVSEVKRVLVKNGVFIVSTPNDAEFMEGNQFHIHEFDLQELNKLMTDSFKHQEFYYQGTWFTAGLFHEKQFTEPQPDGKVAYAKTFGQPLEKAIFFIAVCSDGALPQLQENLVVADRWSTKEDIERDIVRHNKQDADAATVAQLTEQLKQAQSELNAIKSSRWWQARAKTGGAVKHGITKLKGEDHQ